MGPRLLLIETSGRGGWAAAAAGERLVAVEHLDPARKHARDLAPALARVLAAAGWNPTDIDAVAAGRGPGGYTGLRVGLMTARSFAYAAGCRLLGMDTFSCLAHQTPADADAVDITADAQQGKLYAQRFDRRGEAWAAAGPPAVVARADWLAARDPAAWVGGPGAHACGPWPDGTRVVPAELCTPTPVTVAGLALARWHRGEADDLWALGPLYLRASSAEENWRPPVSGPG